MKLTDKATGELVVDIGGDTYGRPLAADASGSFFVYFGHQDDTGIGRTSSISVIQLPGGRAT